MLQHRILQGGSWAFALLVAFPILTIFFTAFNQGENIFAHLLSTVLPTYTINTILLVVSTVLLSLLIGIPLAWLMAQYKFIGSKWLQWALVLPLAMPGYIVGYIYTNWFDFAGPIQIFLRDLMGWKLANEYWFFDLRSLPGAAFILSLVLFPYVYILARAAFMEQGYSLSQSARLLGCSPIQSFFRVSLPLARPAIAVAASLVAMETLGDFGTMSYFSVNTLTTAVYDTWLGYSDLSAAAKISAIMLLVVFVLLSSERYSRRKQKLFRQNNSPEKIEKKSLSGKKALFASVFCLLVLSLSFIAPLGQLIIYAWKYSSTSSAQSFVLYSINSFYVAAVAAVCTLVIALFVNFNRRFNQNKRSSVPVSMAGLGYAVPGTVLAIGVLIMTTSVDKLINIIADMLGFTEPGLLLSGSMYTIFTAFVVRFAAMAIGSVESSLAKVPPSLDMAASTMGCNLFSTIRRVQLPLIHRGCLVAILLVFIESMKELNAALLLRPFNFETLATYVFNYASDEQLEYAAFPAVLLVLVGILPLVIINRAMEKNHND